jgi:hypothetical protein
MTARVCIHNATGAADCAAAARIHGFFDSMKGAREHVHKLAHEQPDVPAYIIEECLRWFPVQEPVKGCAGEEEEIHAPENDDQEQGRMGSVCDIRKQVPDTTNTNASKNDDKVTIFENKPANKASKSKELRSQQQQLDDVLSAPAKTIKTVKEYGEAQAGLSIRAGTTLDTGSDGIIACF